MNKKTEVSYNPQLGYLKTIFSHNFDFLTGVLGYTDRGDGVEIAAGTYRDKKATVLIKPLSPSSYRFRMYPDGTEPGFTNEVFSMEKAAPYQVAEEEDALSIRTARLEIRIRKVPWEVSTYLDGRLLTKEQIRDSNVDNMCKYLPLGYDRDDEGRVIRVRESMYMYADEAFYGFGEKFTEFNKRGQKIQCWQKDALSTNTGDSYKNHPYFMSSRGYSVLVNSFTRMTFDMGCGSNVTYGVEVEDSYLDYILFANRDYKDLLADYVNKTGNIPMIPRWAFGLWMSKCVYQDQEEVYQVIARAEEEGVSIDVMNLDAWQKQEDSGAWVWDTQRFPDPENMIRVLREHKIHLCLWIYPYIGEASVYFRLAAEKGWLVKDANGNPLTFYATAAAQSKVGCFDFTNPGFLEWYVPRVKEVIAMGIGAVKTDFSEAVPENGVYYDGSNGIQGHNKLTYLYAKTIYEAMREVKAPLGERPMLWGRSGYAGSHTIPAAWAGDSSTHGNNHACILQGGLSIALSGVAYWGFDMGGFYNTDHEGYECMPEEEEYIRSIQFGFFSPLSRCHGKTPREPWNFAPETKNIFSYYNRLRHRLMPYLYSAAWQASLESVPMMRPLLMEFQEDRNVRNIGSEYMLGDSLLVAPVFDQDDFALYLPEGTWADFFTGRPVEGGRWISLKPALDQIPVYIRPNTIVSMRSDPDGGDPENPFTDLTICMNLKDRLSCVCYDDNGKNHFTAEWKNGSLAITTGLPVKQILLYGQGQLTEVTCNGVSSSWERRDEYTYSIPSGRLVKSTENRI